MRCLYLLILFSIASSLYGTPSYFKNGRGELRVREGARVLFASGKHAWTMSGDSVYCLLEAGPPMRIVRYDAWNDRADTITLHHDYPISREYYFFGTGLLHQKLAVARGGHYGCVFLPGDSGNTLSSFDLSKGVDTLRAFARPVDNPEPLHVAGGYVAWIEHSMYIYFYQSEKGVKDTARLGTVIYPEIFNGFLPTAPGEFLIVDDNKLLRWQGSSPPQEVAHWRLTLYPGENHSNWPSLVFHAEEPKMSHCYVLEYQPAERTFNTIWTGDSVAIAHVSVDREGNVHCYYYDIRRNNVNGPWDKYEAVRPRNTTNWITRKLAADDDWVRVY